MLVSGVTQKMLPVLGVTLGVTQKMLTVFGGIQKALKKQSPLRKRGPGWAGPKLGRPRAQSGWAGRRDKAGQGLARAAPDQEGASEPVPAWPGPGWVGPGLGKAELEVVRSILSPGH